MRTFASTIPLSILKKDDLKSNHKIVYGCVYSFKPEPCYMKTADFVKETGISKLTILKAIAELKKRNLVKESKYGGLEAIELED